MSSSAPNSAIRQADLAKVIGKSRSHVANTLRLLKLPERTQQLLVEGAISAGHARALLAVADPDADRRAHRRTGAYGARRRAPGAKGGPEGPRRATAWSRA